MSKKKRKKMPAPRNLVQLELILTRKGRHSKRCEKKAPRSKYREGDED